MLIITYDRAKPSLRVAPHSELLRGAEPSDRSCIEKLSFISCTDCDIIVGGKVLLQSDLSNQS